MTNRCPHGADLATGDCDDCYERETTADAERVEIVTPYTFTTRCMRHVCAAFGVSSGRVRSTIMRDRRTVEARRMVYWLLRLGGLSYPEIGRQIGCDHTSAMHGVRVARQERAASASYRALTDQMAAAIGIEHR